MENFEKETAKVFGKRFRALMAANGDTSATATTKLNVSAAIIAKWRQGKSRSQRGISQANLGNLLYFFRLFAWAQ